LENRREEALNHTLRLVLAILIMASVILMVGQAVSAENSILYLHYGRDREQSGTLDYNLPARSTGNPIKAETTEAWPGAYVFVIRADFDTNIPGGSYIFNLWIKADNDQRIVISLGCRSQTGATVNFGGALYEVKQNMEITEYSFDYPMQEPYKIYKGEWFYAQISLGTGLTLYIDHQSTPSSIITPTPVAIPEFPYGIYSVLLIGMITCILLTRWKSILVYF